MVALNNGEVAIIGDSVRAILWLFFGKNMTEHGPWHQSINGLCWVSQSSLSTAENSESNWVTKYLMEWVVPQGNWTERVRAEVIELCIDLLMRQSGIGGIGIAGRLCSATYPSSIKEQVELESRKMRKERSNFSQIRGRERESEVTTALSHIAVSAQGVLVWQSSICAVSGGLPILFSSPGQRPPELQQSLLSLSKQSLTQCPFLPQNKQRLLSIQYWCSFAVSLPWESSWPVRLGLKLLRVFSRTARQEDFPLDCSFYWLVLPSREHSWMHSQ